MDSTAIQEIRDLAIASHAAKAFRYDRVILPSNYSVFDFEKFNTRPNRLRGHFKTQMIDEFAAYVNSNCDEHTKIFVDIDNSCAVAIIDIGDSQVPQWGDHRATVQLVKTPEYEALCSRLNKPIDQSGFIDFIEDYSSNFRFFDEENKDMGVSDVISTVRKMMVVTGSEKTSDTGNFKATLSAFDSIEVNAKTGKLPAGFNFHFVPYEGIPIVLAECRLRTLASGEKPLLAFRAIGFENMVAEIGKSFKAELQESINRDLGGFYCGTMVYQGK